MAYSGYPLKRLGTSHFLRSYFDVLTHNVGFRSAVPPGGVKASEVFDAVEGCLDESS